MGKLKDRVNRLSTLSKAAVILGILGAAGLVHSISTEKRMEAQLEERISGLEEELHAKDASIADLEEQLDLLVNDSPEVYLPERLYAAVGRTLELYNAQVAFHGTIDAFSFDWQCDIGKCLERKYQVTAEADAIGEHPLKLTIYNSRLEKVYEKEIILEIVQNVIEWPTKILNIGDSFSDSTPWYEEVSRLSEGKITFVGTRGSGEYMHEGRSGFTICDYTTETEYTYGGEGVHPFYNPDTDGFDFSYYKEQTGVEPDAVQFFLGKNGMSLDPEPGIEWLLEMVNDVRETDPDLPIYIVQTVYLGDQDGIGNEVDGKGRSALNGWWKLEEDKKVFLWTSALEEAFGDMDEVYLIPAALEFDSAYNYRTAVEPVNARSSRTEAVLKEGLHPSTEGYLQIADILFSSYCGTME